VIDKVSGVICDWNVHMEYSQRNANCQHFIDDICAVLNVSLDKFTGSMSHYLDKLRTKGMCKMKYTIPYELMEKLGIKEQKLEIPTHQELDSFVGKIMDKIPKFEEEFPEDFQLLKAFDRAFWLKHFRDPSNENYRPISRKELNKAIGNRVGEDNSSGGVGGGDAVGGAARVLLAFKGGVCRAARSRGGEVLDTAVCCGLKGSEGGGGVGGGVKRF
jgi:hypothetical protein